jgi:hypothetical protein
MKRSIEITVNGIPADTFQRFIWNRDGKYLLQLIRIDVSHKPHTLTAIARYSYPLEIEKHKGYIVAIVHLLGRSWLINIGRRQFYVQQINKEAE